MAIATNGINTAYNGTYASKILLEPMFVSDDIMRNYTIYPNVKYKKQLIMAPELVGITEANSACGATSSCGQTNTFAVTDKHIHAHNVAVKQEQCWTTFKDEVIVESYRNGINMPDLTGTQIAEVIINRVRGGIKSDMTRNMWAGLADNSAASGTNDCTYESMGNGLWYHLAQDSSFADSGKVKAFKGAGATADYNVVGAAMSSDDAQTLLQKAYDNAPTQLKKVPAGEKRMFVTPNVYDGYYASLTQVGNAGAVDYGHSMSQAGRDRLYFRGVEVVPMYEWDTALTAVGANSLVQPAVFTTTEVTGGAAINVTNACIYAAKSNLFIGTDTNSPETQLKMFYDEVSDKMYIRSHFTMGFQFGWSSLIYGACLTP
tara:strand:+ start:728 stop:1849 length:1122 start_codon:yes stop_codon:yes gene_type:complete